MPKILDRIQTLVRGKRERRFEAAGGGRRWSGEPHIENLNSAILAGATPVRRRAQYYARNNPHAAAGVRTLVDNMVGTGIKPRSQHPDRNVRERLHGLWAEWVDQADADGQGDFYALQARMARQMIEDGESFARMEVAGRGRVPLQLRTMASDQVDPNLSRELGGGARIVAGVEYDATARRTAYHLFRTRPGDPLAIAAPLDTMRVPASDMLHLFEVLTSGQVRGVSWLAPILLRLHELDQYEDAQLVRQKVAALFAGFIVDQDGEAGGMRGQRTGSVLESGLEPGTLKVLPPGSDIKFSSPAQVGDVDAFMKAQLRAIAAGLGVTYEQLTGDLTDVNFSSIRAGVIEFRRRMESVQYHTLVHQLCRPAWQRFVTTAVLSGALPASDFERNAADYLRAEWLPPAWAWVDPLKDAQAEKLMVDEGFKSRSEVINGRGLDPEQVDRERSQDRERAERLDTPVRPTAPAAAPQSEQGDTNE